jgi:hypothetical protein
MAREEPESPVAWQRVNLEFKAEIGRESLRSIYLGRIPHFLAPYKSGKLIASSYYNSNRSSPESYWLLAIKILTNLWPLVFWFLCSLGFFIGFQNN